MTLKLHLLVTVLLLCGGCAMAENHRDSNEIATWMQSAFDACIEAQLAIENPLLDAQTRKPKIDAMGDYVVDFTLIPKLPVYSVSVGLVKTYPDAFSFSCRLDRKKHTVLQAAYYQGEPGSDKNKEVNLIDHDPLGGISEGELNSLIQEEKTISVPLADFYE